MGRFTAVTDKVMWAAGPLVCRSVCRVARAATRIVEALSGARVVTAVATQKPLVALTIDDGPHPDTTPALLEVLARHHGHGTFMLIGERANRYADLVDAITGGGNELGNHFMRDEPTVRLGRAAFRQQIAEVDDILGRRGTVKCYRPGSGWFTFGMLRDGSALGRTCALGSPLLVRVHYQDPDRVGRRLAALCHPGAVVVLHEGTPARTGVAATADALLSALSRRGLRTVTLSTLLEAGADERRRPWRRPKK